MADSGAHRAEKQRDGCDLNSHDSVKQTGREDID